MKKEERFLYRISGKAGLAILFLLFLAIELVFSLYLAPGYAEATGGGEIPDMSAAYPATKTAAFLNNISGGNGLVWYNRIQILDSFFPAVYGLLLAGLLYRLYGRKYGDFSRYRWILAVPVGGVAADYLENLTLRILILVRPAEPGFWGLLPGIFSTVKFAGLFFSILFLLTGLGYFLKGRRDAALAPGERKKVPPSGE